MADAAPAPSPPRPQRVLLCTTLFAVTFVSALLSQVLPESGGEWQLVWREPTRLLSGLPFAVTLMTILLAHEMGHFVTARRHGVDQSLPFFIPAPTLFGTFGAVIFMRSQPSDRRVLLNVAVMGPYAGVLLAIPAAAWGLAHSTPVDPALLDTPHYWFGSSLLFSVLERLFSPNGTDVVLHPVGFAGWVGLFVTSLNLVPAGQLDGGHVAYSLFGRLQKKVSLFVLGALVTLGFWLGVDRALIWIFWPLMLFFVMGIGHPPVRDESLALTARQKLNAWCALLLFALTFVPVPIELRMPGESEAPATEQVDSPEEFSL